MRGFLPMSLTFWLIATLIAVVVIAFATGIFVGGSGPPLNEFTNKILDIFPW